LRGIMNLIEKSLHIAVRQHAGQPDKGGATYVLHPLRLMHKLTTDQEMAVALLHDVVEDTPCSLEDLRNEGIPQEVVDAIDCLTKRKGEDSEKSIDRVAANPLARRVKIADLEDNMDIRRLPELSDKDCERLKRYHKA
jgi:(p)ppGpp synthase/HD superfamily hydrolase